MEDLLRDKTLAEKTQMMPPPVIEQPAEINEPVEESAKTKAGKVLLWAFFISLLLTIVVSGVLFFSRKLLEQSVLKSHEKIIEVVLKANRAAILGDHEQAKWILRTLKEVVPLDIHLVESLVISERAIRNAAMLKEIDFAIMKRDIPFAQKLLTELQQHLQASDDNHLVLRAIRERENLLSSYKKVAAKPKAIEKAIQTPPVSVTMTLSNPLSPIETEEKWLRSVSLFKAGQEKEACQQIQEITESVTDDSIWSQKGRSFLERRCSNA